MLEKHQRIKCTGTSFMCTGTPCLKSGSGQSVPVHPKCVPVHPKCVPVHPKCVPVHLFRNLAVAKVYRYTINVYRYTCMRSAGMEQNCDSNAGAYLSIILDHEMTLERSIKDRGYVEKAVFDL